ILVRRSCSCRAALSPRPPCPDAFFSSAARSFMALRSVVENPPVLLVFIVLPPQRLFVDQVRPAPSRAEGTDIRRSPDSTISTGWEDPAFCAADKKRAWRVRRARGRDGCRTPSVFRP